MFVFCKHSQKSLVWFLYKPSEHQIMFYDYYRVQIRLVLCSHCSCTTLEFAWKRTETTRWTYVQFPLLHLPKQTHQSITKFVVKLAINWL